MTNPFQHGINILNREADKLATDPGTAGLITAQMNAANLRGCAGVLEAAGRVDKILCDSLLISAYDHYDSRSEIIDQLRTLLAALPDSPKPVKH